MSKASATETTSRSHQAPAVARAAAVLRVLADAGEGLGVNEVARRSGLVPSSSLHILRALTEEGLAAFDEPSKRYSLGLGLLTLAHDMLGHNPFSTRVQPELQLLANQHRATAIAVQLDERERMVVVAVAQAPTLLQIQVGVGSRFPAYISATGRCIAAWSNLSEAQLKRRFETLKWQSPPSFAQWLREVNQARRDGFAIDAGHYINGFTVIAAPLIMPPPHKSDQAPRQAIAVVCVSEQLDIERRQALAEQTRDAAARVALRLAKRA